MSTPGQANPGAFEDSSVELLRPLLRQWLDTNMTSMVAKALKVEGTRAGTGQEN
jgi:cell pole-organizing protein PopZ